MSFAAILALAASATAPVTDAQPRRPVAQVRASVRILKARRIELDKVTEERNSDVIVRRDAAGTTWIEFS